MQPLRLRRHFREYAFMSNTDLNKLLSISFSRIVGTRHVSGGVRSWDDYSEKKRTTIVILRPPTVVAMATENHIAIRNRKRWYTATAYLTGKRSFGIIQQSGKEWGGTRRRTTNEIVIVVEVNCIFPLSSTRKESVGCGD